MLLLLILSFIHTGDQTKKTDFYNCRYSFKIEYYLKCLLFVLNISCIYIVI